MGELGPRLPGRTLGIRLFTPRLLVGTLVMAGVVFGGMRSISAHFEDQARRRAENLILGIVIAAEETADRGDLQRIVAQHGASRDVRRIVVAEGAPLRVVASTRAASRGETLSRLADDALAEDLAKARSSGLSVTERGRPGSGYRVTSPLIITTASRSDGEAERG
ncbi:MAG: hypothetical protein IT386_03215, partial [Deltaproteobacteria bacterium]|nr:hypothetical protein [Deltaproteobacteria bacterium]